MRPDLNLLDALALAVFLFGLWCGAVALGAAAVQSPEKIRGLGRRPSIFDNSRPMARKVKR